MLFGYWGVGGSGGLGSLSKPEDALRVQRRLMLLGYKLAKQTGYGAINRNSPSMSFASPAA